MSKAIRIFQGSFGRVALLDMDEALVTHAHPHCHVLLKASGADTQFCVDGEMQPLRDDSAVLINAWAPHSYAHRPGAPRTVIMALYIEPRWLAQMQKEFTASGLPGFFPHPCVEITPRVRELADSLTCEMLYGTARDEEREELLFDLMIAIIERFSEWKVLRHLRHNEAIRGTDRRIRRAISVMHESMGEDLDLDHVAREAGLSRAHFFRLFQEATNLTPRLYFNTLRMEAAIMALSDGRESLSDISLRLGFSAPSHFTRFFRNNQGIAPSGYRQVVTLHGAEAARQTLHHAPPFLA